MEENNKISWTTLKTRNEEMKDIAYSAPSDVHERDEHDWQESYIVV